MDDFESFKNKSSEYMMVVVHQITASSISVSVSLCTHTNTRYLTSVVSILLQVDLSKEAGIHDARAFVFPWKHNFIFGIVIKNKHLSEGLDILNRHIVTGVNFSCFCFEAFLK